MRRSPPLAAVLLAALPLAACSTTPRPALPAATPVTAAPQPSRAGLLGLTQAELQQRLGPAPFQLREGPGLKLQWQNTTCVLDAYLYPPPTGLGAAVVTHVDARRPGSGESVAVEGCTSSLAAR
jgi:hypothetical protein